MYFTKFNSNMLKQYWRWHGAHGAAAPAPSIKSRTKTMGALFLSCMKPLFNFR